MKLSSLRPTLAAGMSWALAGIGNCGAQTNAYDGTYTVNIGGTWTTPAWTWTSNTVVDGNPLTVVTPFAEDQFTESFSVEITIAHGSFRVDDGNGDVVSGSIADDGTFSASRVVSSEVGGYSDEVTTYTGKFIKGDNGAVTGSGSWTSDQTEDFVEEFGTGADGWTYVFSPTVLDIQGTGTWTAAIAGTGGGGGGGGGSGGLGGGTISGSATAAQTIPNDNNYHSESKVGGPVDTSTGAESFGRTLISLSGLRTFDFTISYNSLEVSSTGDLGYGWTHPYLATVAEASDHSSVTVTWSSAQIYTYQLTSSSPTPSYQCAIDGVRYDILVKNSDGSYTLTKPDQTAFQFAANGRLVQTANPHGQIIQINRTGDGSALASIVEPVSGATLSFTYANGVITKISDDAARSVTLGYNGAGLLTHVGDLNGNEVDCTYDVNRRITSVTAADGSVIYRNTYDATGRVATQDDGLSTNQLVRLSYDESSQSGKVITTVTDRTGANTVYVHDSLYRLLSVTDPLGHTTSYTYDGSGNRTMVQDALGRTTSFTYDGTGNVLTVTDATGGQTTLTYDTRHNVRSVKRADGKTAAFTYDALNNVLTSTDFAGNKTTVTYGSNSLPSQVKSPRGNSTSFTYISGRLTSATDPLANTTTYAYDSAGRMTSVTGPTGKATTFTSSPSGKILGQTDALGAQTNYAYDVRDRLISVTDPLGAVTKYAYDANNNLLTRTDALNGVTTYTYDGEDRLTQVRDPLHKTTTFGRDAAGRLIAITDPLGNTVQFDLDAVGGRIATYDGLGNKVLQVNYDPRELPTTVTDALMRRINLTFDTLGRLSQQTNPLARTNSYSYDGQSRLIQATDPLGLVSGQAFDADGNRISVTNPAEATTTFAYDAASRLTSFTTAGGRVTKYTYDPRSLLSKIVDPAAHTSTLAYDDAGRLNKLTDSIGEIDYGYDAKGRLLSTVQGGKTIARVYDALDRLTQFTDGDGNVLTYAYDADGNLTTLTYPDGKTVTYTYDDANRMTTVTDWAGRITQYTYDADGRLTKTIRPNGTVQTRSYDKAGALVSLVDLAKDGSVIVQYSFGYDAAGQLVQETRSPAIPPYVPAALTLTYDADNRLTGYAGRIIGYDASGNMLTAPINGNLTTFAYDARNRLTSAGGISYTYDAENRRIRSTSSAGTTSYVVNPNAALSQLLVSVAPSGSATRNVYGLGLIYQDTDGTIVRYLHGDFRGSTVALSGSNGTVIGRVDYGPYGELSTQSGDTTTGFLYVGAMGVETDANGLVFMRARHYNPAIRRFVQQDPFLGKLNRAGALDRYVYGGSNPVGRIDPSGFGFERFGTGTPAMAAIPTSGPSAGQPVLAAAGGWIVSGGLKGKMTIDASGPVWEIDVLTAADNGTYGASTFGARQLAMDSGLDAITGAAAEGGAPVVEAAVAATELPAAVVGALALGVFVTGYTVGDVVVNQWILGLPPSISLIPDVRNLGAYTQPRHPPASGAQMLPPQG